MSPGPATGGYASVAVPVPVRRLFTYRVEAGLADRIAEGARVRVPFGHRDVIGTVVGWPVEPPAELEGIRPVEALAADPRSLPLDLLPLTRFVADYYLCSWGEAIEAALPPVPGAGRHCVRRRPGVDPDALSPRAVARRAVLAAIPADGAALPVDRLDRKARRHLLQLERAGLIERLTTWDATDPAEPVQPSTEPPPVPTPAQAAVLGELQPALVAGGYAPHLLFGETGSGKTEVYFRAARQVLDAGRGVLYLVPEIGLTPLLLERVRARFGGDVGMLHSGIGRRARFETWERVRRGTVRFVLGTRSAVFAPVPDLGLIVVDEEHDGSYKQEETPRYNGRDLAVVRARAADCALVLGSATPSLESFRHAESGRYRLLRLGGRVAQRPLPEVRLVDMRDTYRDSGAISPISEELGRELRACVERGEQALVLRNRRGWSAAVFCPGCGDRVRCRSCSIALTWHRGEGRLRCHYCGFHQAFPERCPRCRGDALKLLGEGTEHVEALIRAEVPGARVERMDRDTIRRRGAHERLLRRFDAGEIDVLVGTQMIAKGHDFHRVTLVGVISADQALGLPDFRAAERAFQLLTQVAGRAGRGARPGRVVIQAFDPDHPVLQQAATQDFEAFYRTEIEYRRALRYPPLAALVQIVIRDREAHRAALWAEELARALRDAGAGRLLIGGPGPAPIERLKGLWRQQILVRTAGRRRLIQAVERALEAVEGRVPRRALTVDVDPYSLL